jgi:hypothetical protein
VLKLDDQTTNLIMEPPGHRKRGRPRKPKPKIADLPTKRHGRRRLRTPRDLVDIGRTSAAGRFFTKMQRDITSDLQGGRSLSRIEVELISAFCGAATTVRYLSRQVCLGDISDLDLSAYATLASVMLRLGSRLGFSRRAKDVTTLSDLIRADQEAQRQQLAEDALEDVGEDAPP